MEFHKVVCIRTVALSAIFVNELLSWIISDMKMYADDTKVWCRIKTETDCSITLQEDLIVYTCGRTLGS